MKLVLSQIQDTTAVSTAEQGRQLIAEHIYLLTILTGAVVVVGTVLLLRYFFFDRRRQHKPNEPK